MVDTTTNINRNCIWFDDINMGIRFVDVKRGLVLMGLVKLKPTNWNKVTLPFEKPIYLKGFLE